MERGGGWRGDLVDHFATREGEGEDDFGFIDAGAGFGEKFAGDEGFDDLTYGGTCFPHLGGDAGLAGYPGGDVDEDADGGFSQVVLACSVENDEGVHGRC